MSWQAKGLYRELLDEYWAEGSLPVDHGELADICGCGLDEFKTYWPEIKGCWDESDESLANATMDSMRTETDSKRVTNAKNGKAGAIKKLANASGPLANAKQTPSERQNVSSERHIEEKRREEKSKEKQKTSLRQAQSDPRHVPFRDECQAYAIGKSVEFTWDGGEAKQLAMLLAASPGLTLGVFQQCLKHRARSVVTHGERPREWLGTILKYQEGPLDQYGKPQGAGNGSQSKTGANLSVAEQGLAILAQRRRNSEVADQVLLQEGSGAESADALDLRRRPIELLG